MLGFKKTQHGKLPPLATTILLPERGRKRLGEEYHKIRKLSNQLEMCCVF